MDIIYPNHSCKIILTDEIYSFFVPLAQNISLSGRKLKKLVESQVKVFLRKKKILKDEQEIKDVDNIQYVYKKYSTGILIFIFLLNKKEINSKKYNYILPLISFLKELHDYCVKTFLFKDNKKNQNIEENKQDNTIIKIPESFDVKQENSIILSCFRIPHPNGEANAFLYIYLGELAKTHEIVFIDYYEGNEQKDDASSYLKGVIQHLNKEYKTECALIVNLNTENFIKKIISDIPSTFCFKKKKNFYLREISLIILFFVLMINIIFSFKQSHLLKRNLQIIKNLTQRYSNLQSRILKQKYNEILLQNIPQTLLTPWNPINSLLYMSKKFYAKDNIWISKFVLDRKILYNNGLIECKINIANKNPIFIKKTFKRLIKDLKGYKMKTKISRKKNYIILTIELNYSDSRSSKNEKNLSKNNEEIFFNNAYSYIFNNRKFYDKPLFDKTEQEFGIQTKTTSSTNQQKSTIITKLKKKRYRKNFTYSLWQFFVPTNVYASETTVKAVPMYSSKKSGSLEKDKTKKFTFENIQSESRNNRGSSPAERDIEKIASLFKRLENSGGNKQTISNKLCSNYSELKLSEYYDKRIVNFMKKPSFLRESKDKKQKKDEFIVLNDLLKQQKEKISYSLLLITEDIVLIKANNSTKIITARLNDKIDNKFILKSINLEQKKIILQSINDGLEDLVISLNNKLPQWKPKINLEVKKYQ